jgi:3-hydroxyisobutyrate dehydrogenase-like beta-hydroxyacid dehydrogenase
LRSRVHRMRLTTACRCLKPSGKRLFASATIPSDANLVKLSGIFLISSVIEALGEAMALVGKAGLDEHQYVDFLTSTLFNAPVYKMSARPALTCPCIHPKMRAEGWSSRIDRPNHFALPHR